MMKVFQIMNISCYFEMNFFMKMKVTAMYCVLWKSYDCKSITPIHFKRYVFTSSKISNIDKSDTDKRRNKTHLKYIMKTTYQFKIEALENSSTNLMPKLT